MVFVKKVLSAFLAAAVIFSTMPLAAYSAEQSETGTGSDQFSDMPNDWSTNALEEAVTNGLLMGAGQKIMPDANLTRAQMAAMIVRAFGAFKNGDITAFTDVKSTDWFKDDLEKAFQMGVLEGWDGKLNPNDPITRQEAFVILARALKLQPDQTISKTFTDAGTIASWARREVYALINDGYIEGYNGKLAPADAITRAEFAQIIHNIIKQYIKTSGEVTAVSDGNIMINVPGVTLKNLVVNGDLIIGDGVGDGEIVLDNVQVVGRMVVRGGGEHSIMIRGSSTVSNIIVSRIDAGVSIKISPEADVEVIYIDDGSNNVTLQGTIGTVTVAASDIVVTATDAFIDTLSMIGENSTLIVGSDSAVNTVMVQENAANSTLAVGGTITHITTSASGTEISGTGKVTKVEALSGATGGSIQTAGTQIVVAAGVTGVTGCGSTAIAGGITVSNNESGTGIISSGGSDDSPLMTMNITGLGIMNSATVTFSSDVAGATIQWNGTYLQDKGDNILTVNGLNTITVPAIAANANNSFNLRKTGYSTFTDNTLIWLPVDTVTVTGEGDAAMVVNGGTLQMNAAVLPADATNPSITWSIQSGSGSATIHASTGLFTATTAGTVTVTAAAVDGSGVVGSRQITVYPAAPDYTIDYTAEKTAQAVPAEQEYSTDNGTSWTAGTGMQLALTPGQNIQLRVRAAGVVPAGLIQTLIVAERPATPAYPIDFTAEKIAGFASGDAYSLDGFATAGVVPGPEDLALTGTLAPNAAGGAAKQLSIKTLATLNSFASAEQVLSIPARPAVGDYTIDYAAETTVQAVPLTEEYRPDGDGIWQAGANALCSLTPGVNMIFRSRATESSFVSEPKTLSVPARPADSAPAFTYAVGSRDTLYGLPADASNLEARISSDGGATWASWSDIEVDASGQALLTHGGGDLIQVRMNAVPGVSFAGESTERYSKKALGELTIGSKVVDASWSWEFKTGNNYTGTGLTQAVSWIVVADEHYGAGSGVTLLSEKLIGRFVFDNSTDVHPYNGDSNWGDSNHIRPWLNSTGTYASAGFYHAFSDNFKNAVLTTNVPNIYYGPYAYTTQDKVFIPSTTELGDPDYTTRTNEIGTVYPFFAGAGNADRIAKLGTVNSAYWTRSTHIYYTDIVICFLGDGSQGVYTRTDNLCAIDNDGVRPAVNLSGDILVSGSPNTDGLYEIFYE